MTGYIYKITSPSKRIYIGQTVNIKERIRHYKNNLCLKQRRLYNSLKKYNWDKHHFEILEECSISSLNNRERYYQDLFNVTGKKGLNIRLVKSEDRSGILPDYIKNKISKKNSGFRNGMYGKKITEKAKILQRLKLSGELNYLSKWLLNTQTGIYYPCLNQAAMTINMDKRVLWQNLKINKKNKTDFIYV